MAKDQLHSKMGIDTRGISITGCLTAQANSPGPMALYIKASLLIIGLQAKEYISGQMEVFMKVKSKMGSGTAMVFIRSMTQLTKANGKKGKNKVRAK